MNQNGSVDTSHLFGDISLPGLRISRQEGEKIMLNRSSCLEILHIDKKAGQVRMCVYDTFEGQCDDQTLNIGDSTWIGPVQVLIQGIRNSKICLCFNDDNEGITVDREEVFMRKVYDEHKWASRPSGDKRGKLNA